MLNIKAPIYTVHDNFISTAEYSEILPIFYSHAFCMMGSPLSIINKYIYMNIIKPFVKGVSNELTEDYFENRVIPKDELSKYLMYNVPEKVSKNMMADWEKRISVILTCYEDYTRHVSGKSPNPSFHDHMIEWKNFQSKMWKCAKDSPNYSLHN